MPKKRSADKYFSKGCICRRTRIVIHEKDWWKSLSPARMKKLKLLSSRFLNQVSFFIFLGQQLNVNLSLWSGKRRKKQRRKLSLLCLFLKILNFWAKKVLIQGALPTTCWEAGAISLMGCSSGCSS